jgi:hypothetical protein
VLVVLHIIGDAHKGQAKTGPVAAAGVEVEKVVLVGERIKLDADRRPVLPGADVILIIFAPRRHVRRQGFTRYPERQPLVLYVRRGPAYEAVRGRRNPSP